MDGESATRGSWRTPRPMEASPRHQSRRAHTGPRFGTAGRRRDTAPLHATGLLGRQRNRPTTGEVTVRLDRHTREGTLPHHATDEGNGQEPERSKDSQAEAGGRDRRRTRVPRHSLPRASKMLLRIMTAEGSAGLSRAVRAAVPGREGRATSRGCRSPIGRVMPVKETAARDGGRSPRPEE